MKIKEHWALDGDYEESYRSERRHLLITAGGAGLSLAAVAFGVAETADNNIIGPMLLGAGEIGTGISVGGVLGSVKILRDLERRRLRGLAWAHNFYESYSRMLDEAMGTD